MVGAAEAQPGSGSRSRRRASPAKTRLLTVPSVDPEPLRELRLRQAAVVGQLERLALVGRQLRERGLHRTPLLAHRGFLVGRLGRRDRRVFERLGAPPVLRRTTSTARR